MTLLALKVVVSRQTLSHRQSKPASHLTARITNRINFSFPESITAVISGIVMPIDLSNMIVPGQLSRLPVSAILVAITIFLTPSGGTIKAFSWSSLETEE
jgi:hypothetical protein